MMGIKATNHTPYLPHWQVDTECVKRILSDPTCAGGGPITQLELAKAKEALERIPGMA